MEGEALAVLGNNAYTGGMMREQIEKEALDALGTLKLSTEGVVVEYIDESAFGDITTNAAMVAANTAGKSPRDLAEEIISTLGEIAGVEKVEIAGPGFINFTLTKEAVGESILNALKEGDSWGKNETRKGQRVMVEYTDPNPFKEFHIGHLMSNAIGESIARLIEFSGAEVHRANYQGDVGPHVAQAIWGIQKLGLDAGDSSQLGRAYAAGAAAYKDDESAKAEIDRINTVVYDRSDEAINTIYDTGRNASLEHFEDLYKILGTKFDHYFFESESAPIGIELVQAHKDIFEESDGAIVYKGEQNGLHTRVFITGKGTPTYETKDIGLIKLKSDAWPVDQSIVITANEQREYFKVMLAAANRIMPELAKKVHHIVHGMMRLESGKMSSRTGDVITGESLLMKLADAAKERAAESKTDNVEMLAQQIAVAAIKYQILRQGIGKDTIFDEEKALSLEGDSGPYIQYAYARAKSVISAAEKDGIKAMAGDPQTDGERLVTRLLMQFPDVVLRAQNEYEPHYVAGYVLSLAAHYNSWYAAERVLGSDNASLRVSITEAVALTIKNSLNLLGIEAPEKM